MNLPTILPAVLAGFCLTSPASAITIDDLSPGALSGKTLNCTIDHSAAPFATTGTWNATFEKSPAGAFTIQKLTGDTVSGTGTVAFKSFASDIYTYTITSFIDGESPCSLYLWIFEGAAHYELELMHGTVYVASEGGTFTFGTGSKVPEIGVQQPAGSELADGKPASKRSFGSVKVGRAGKAKLFTIKNNGTANLTGISVKKDGAAKGDFAVSQPAKTTLAAGESTKFKVTFSPSAKGVRKAALHIKSNDADENPFDIGIGGEGVK